MSFVLSNMSRPNTTQAPANSLIDVQVYYDGLETKHWVALRPCSTFLELKEYLSRADFAGIPIKNQKLIYCGVIPLDSDTMAKHCVASGRFRVCLVRVKSPGELQRSEEVEEEGKDTSSEGVSEELREDRRARLNWVGRFTGEQGERAVTNWTHEGRDGDALSITFFDAAVPHAWD
jgi:hypothetical protein